MTTTQPQVMTDPRLNAGAFVVCPACLLPQSWELSPTFEQNYRELLEFALQMALAHRSWYSAAPSLN